MMRTRCYPGDVQRNNTPYLPVRPNALNRVVRSIVGVALILVGWTVASADDLLLADFEAPSYGAWQSTGEAFQNGPVSATQLRDVRGFRGSRLVNSFGGGDSFTGTLTSPEFQVNRQFVSFLIGGGRHDGETGIELLVNGQSIRSATGEDSGLLRWVSWDVSELQGQTARLRIYDRSTGSWGHINLDQILLTDHRRAGSGLWRIDEYRRSPDYYQERFRPAYHFTPELNWMNDPNGLVYFDGEYHLFYQCNPHGSEWGHMTWGHAVSPDLLHWKHLPLAIPEEYGVMAFSGSAVVDHQNTSGFGVGNQPPLVAIFTGHGLDRQTQDLAFSRDRGRTWTKYAGNPVIDIGEKDFRDPKVFWHAQTRRWVMVVALAVQKKIQFYGSADLKAWSLLSEFGPAGVHAKLNWECPDLFELPIINEPGQARWILEADMGNGSIAGGSGGEYFIGHFDGTTFTSESKESQWVDYGRDFYAPVSWSNIPETDGRRLWIGWMNNWETCLNPTDPWRSAMSTPREVTLRRINGRLRLCQTPVRELHQLRGQKETHRDTSLGENPLLLPVQSQSYEILVEFQPGSATEVGLRVLKNGEQQTTIGYHSKSASLFVDRTKSGIVDYHPAFPGKHSGPLQPDSRGNIRLRVLVDRCSVEVFGNDGETVITDLVFPDEDSRKLELYAIGGDATLVSFEAYNLKPTWEAPAALSPKPSEER